MMLNNVQKLILRKSRFNLCMDKKSFRYLPIIMLINWLLQKICHNRVRSCYMTDTPDSYIKVDQFTALVILLIDMLTTLILQFRQSSRR